jgi:hypothetical protein
VPSARALQIAGNPSISEPARYISRGAFRIGQRLGMALSVEVEAQPFGGAVRRGGIRANAKAAGSGILPVRGSVPNRHFRRLVTLEVSEEERVKLAVHLRR